VKALQLLLILDNELRHGGVVVVFIAIMPPILSAIFDRFCAGSGTTHGDVIVTF
jgi:hypothetical protein